MRKTTPIFAFILLLLAAESVVYPIIMQSCQRAIQRKMKHRLEEEMLHTVLIPKNELRWVKPGKEIIVDDKMFDVESITELNNGFYRITGLYDHEETSIKNLMKKRQQDADENGNKQLVQLLQLMQANVDETYAVFAADNFIKIFPFLSPGILPSPFTSILTPPPQC